MDFSIDQLLIGGLFGLGALSAVLYNVLPFRKMPDRRPSLAWFPKYRSVIPFPEYLLNADNTKDTLDQMLLVYGFEEHGGKEGNWCFVRYAPNDKLYYSIHKARVRVQVKKNNTLELRLAAPVMLTFDRGEYYAFLNELSNQLKYFTGFNEIKV
ncbi:MAG: hypothetical protein OCD01_06015 [Fibrobacterales bacterium]